MSGKHVHHFQDIWVNVQQVAVRLLKCLENGERQQLLGQQPALSVNYVMKREHWPSLCMASNVPEMAKLRLSVTFLLKLN